MAKYPLVAQSDCTVDMKQEAIDICVAACERHPADLEKCTQVGRDGGWGKHQDTPCSVEHHLAAAAAKHARKWFQKLLNCLQLPAVACNCLPDCSHHCCHSMSLPRPSFPEGIMNDLPPHVPRGCSSCNFANR